jgi:uncharacterized protein (TIGR03435 family)
MRALAQPWTIASICLLLTAKSVAGQASPGQPAQPQSPTRFVFDVASVKPALDTRRSRIFRHADDAEFSAQNVTLKALVQFAFGVTDLRVLGFPGAFAAEHFDLQAHPDLATDALYRTLHPDDAREAKQHMVQALLAERCRLQVHRETRQLPVFALVVARGGPRFGPAEDPNSNSAWGGWNHIGIEGGHSMVRLAEELSRVSGRPVIDHTGLPGRYDLELEWADDDDDDSDMPRLFSAVSEQLGLKLEARRAPVEVIVIDHIELPSAN